MFAWYYTVAARAADLINPHRLNLPAPPGLANRFPERSSRPDSPAAALAWFEAEHANLLAAVVTAARARDPRWAWYIADRHARFLATKGPVTDALTIAKTAVDAARKAGDVTAEAHSMLVYANAQINLGHTVSLRTLHAALPLAERSGWRLLQVACLTQIGDAYHIIGDLTAAENYSSQALDLVPEEELGTLPAYGINDNIPVIAALRGDFDRAEHLLQARLAAGPPGSHRAWTLIRLAEISAARDRLDDALATLDEALLVAGEVSAQRAALCGRGQRAYLLAMSGRCQEALAEAGAALDLAENLRHQPEQARALLAAAKAWSELADFAAASSALRKALTCARRGGDRLLEIRCLTDAALVSGASGDGHAARTAAREALRLARQGGYVALEAQAADAYRLLTAG